MQDEHIKVPSRFWKSITTEEFNQILANDGCLTADLCARLWRMEDRQGPPPESATVYVWKPDLDRLLKRARKETRQKR